MGEKFTVPAAYFERMKRCTGTRPRPKVLAPLDADSFLTWSWCQGPKEKGTSPLTVDDVWWEFAHRGIETTREQIRRDYVRIAARVRRNQRLGLEPFEGIA